MDLQETHPLLFDFFAGYFPDADLDGLTDKEIVAQFIEQNTPKIVSETQNALITLNNAPIVLQNIADEANRYFESSEEIMKWLEMIKENF